MPIINTYVHPSASVTLPFLILIEVLFLQAHKPLYTVFLLSYKGLDGEHI